jgi:uncharacterized lipoprotein YddW (UPF0748 family)
MRGRNAKKVIFQAGLRAGLLRPLRITCITTGALALVLACANESTTPGLVIAIPPTEEPPAIVVEPIRPIGPVEPVVSPIVQVAAPRAFRAVWMSTVYNLTWPSRTGLEAVQAIAELKARLDEYARTGVNAIFFQVRPESDALYKSEKEPWSRFLTGVQGRDPGYDPLASVIELAHQRGIEVHAWLNPYRAATERARPLAESHIANENPAAAFAWGSQSWMDPGDLAVREHVLSVTQDISSRYDIDGIHLDDYFYPYPLENEPARTIPDTRSYSAYRARGGTLEIADFRRDNVNQLIAGIATSLARTRPDVRFGVSPFGIWKSGVPAGIRGLDAYSVIYCDPPTWLERGWLDYLAPQLYWPTTRKEQDFRVLLKFWSDLATPDQHVIAGHTFAKIGDAEFPPSELSLQLTLVSQSRASGSAIFTRREIQADREGARSKVLGPAWASPHILPRMKSAPKEALVALQVGMLSKSGMSGPILTLPQTPKFPEAGRPRALLVYRKLGDTYTLFKVVPASEGSFLISTLTNHQDAPIRDAETDARDAKADSQSIRRRNRCRRRYVDRRPGGQRLRESFESQEFNRR